MDIEGITAKLACQRAQSLEALAPSFIVLAFGTLLHHAQHDALQLRADIELRGSELVENEQHQPRLNAVLRLGFDEMPPHGVGELDSLTPSRLHAVADILKHRRQHQDVGGKQILVGVRLGSLRDQAFHNVKDMLGCFGERIKDQARRQPGRATGDIGTKQLA
jgi:hypothetical protein